MKLPSSAKQHHHRHHHHLHPSQHYFFPDLDRLSTTSAMSESSASHRLTLAFSQDEQLSDFGNCRHFLFLDNEKTKGECDEEKYIVYQVQLILLSSGWTMYRMCKTLPGFRKRVSQRYHLVILSCHLVLLLPCHPVILSFCYLFILSSCHHGIISWSLVYFSFLKNSHAHPL